MRNSANGNCQLIISLLLWIGMVYNFVGNSHLLGQSPILERTVNLHLRDVRLPDALEQLAEAGDFFLAYNPAILPTNQRVSIYLSAQSVKEGLEDILAAIPLTYRVLGDHVLLRPASKVKPALPQPTSPSPHPPLPIANIRIAGIVKDATTGKALNSASLELLPLQDTSRTDGQGRFTFKVPIADSLNIGVYKAGYRPVEISFSAEQDISVGIIELIPIRVEAVESRVMPPILTTSRNPLEEMLWVRLLVSSSVLNEPSGPKKLTTSWGQVSVIPPLGTRWTKGGQYKNNLSLNVLAGYSGALEGVEIGGLLNATRYRMAGIQIAGLANGVGGHTLGLQLAGGFNLSLSTLSGIQVAGLLNTAFEMNGGLQVAGMANLLRYEMRGAQVAGIINLSTGQIRGLQTAGLMSLSWGKVQGAQVSGILNLARELNGVQVALFNFGGDVHGVQVGLLNLNRRMRGIPIGLLSLVNEGHQSLALGADEWWPLQATLRLGVPRFYNVFALGIRGQNGNIQRGFSYGFGGYVSPVQQKLRLKLEAVATRLMASPNIGIRPQVRLLWERKWNTGLFIEAGPSLSLFVAFPNQDIDPADSLFPYALIQQVERGSLRRQYWAGAQISFGWLREERAKY